MFHHSTHTIGSARPSSDSAVKATRRFCDWSPKSQSADEGHIGLHHAGMDAIKPRAYLGRNPKLPEAVVLRRWAVRIGCDPRTLRKELLRSGAVTGIVGHRIREFLRRSGEVPIPPSNSMCGDT